MKTYNNFILEDLKLMGSGSYSDAYKGSKHDILKKSKNDSYSDKELMVYEQIKKRPDLFCQILKINKEQVLVQQLDAKNFEKTYTYYFNILTDEIRNLRSFIEDLEEENPINITRLEKHKNEIQFLKTLKNYYFDLNKRYSDVDYDKFIKNSLYKDVIDFIRNHIEIKHQIFDFLKEFNDKNNTEFDLHEGNFGFIKGTKQIRCFDPIKYE